MAYRLIERHEIDEKGEIFKEKDVVIIKRSSSINVERVKPNKVESARLDEKLAKQLEIDFVRDAFVMTLSSDRIDRYRDIIRVPGWDLRDFTAAGGPLLLGHKSSQVIGHVPALWKHDDKPQGKNKLKGVAALSAETDLAHETLRMINGGQIRAGSVGFVPNKVEFIKDADGWITGFDFIEQELVEHSITPTPANPDALIGKSMEFPHFMRFMEQRIDEKVAEEGMESAYLTIQGKRIQVDTLPAKASGVTQKTWNETLARISTLEGEVKRLQSLGTIEKVEREEPWLVLV